MSEAIGAPAPDAERLRRRLDRERAARLEAERIAEVGLRQLYEQREYLRLLESITAAANSMTSLNDVFQFTLTEVCRFKEWPVGHAYLRSGGERPQLVPTPIWHVGERERLETFRQVTEATSFESGLGLPGRVLETGKPAWITRLADDTNFPRAEAALTAGLTTAFAFPVVVGEEVTAVLEFFSDKAIEPDAELLRLMSHVGAQLGRVVERKRAEDKLLHDASHDSLTGLPNRALFRDRLACAVARRKRAQEYHFAVLFVDLDRFKIVNDSMGHAAGDALICEVAQRLMHTLRESDLVASPHALPLRDSATLARLGGDEFIVLVDDLANPQDGVNIAMRLQRALAAPFEIAGRTVYITASVGIASSASGYGVAEDIMRDADIAMYRAKTLGRARAEIYDDAMRAAAVKRLSVETGLRDAIERGDFVLHYQPIVALETGRVSGFEALVRWQRTPQEIVFPGDFITVAEETGLIVPIGTWVLKEACRTMARWRREVAGAEHLTVSVNVSARQFAQKDIVSQVLAVIAETGVPPQALFVEITESSTMGDAAHAIAVLSQLKAAGVRLSIDDFGTGYSSLSYLHRFPLDVLKIDRSFIVQMEGDAQIVRAIVALARALDMRVVAEGTETAMHVSRLRALGCEYAQGYYYSKPVATDAATRLITGAGFAPA